MTWKLRTKQCLVCSAVRPQPREPMATSDSDNISTGDQVCSFHIFIVAYAMQPVTAERFPVLFSTTLECT